MTSGIQKTSISLWRILCIVARVNHAKIFELVIQFIFSGGEKNEGDERGDIQEEKEEEEERER